MKDREISGSLEIVHFLRHFVRPILPQVRELVPGFTFSNINKMAKGKKSLRNHRSLRLPGLSCKATATKMVKM